MRRVFAGLAAGTMANAVQMLVFAAEGRTSTTHMFASHWLAVGLFHVIVALLFSGVARNRLWSAVVFLFPIATVTGGVIEAQLGSTGFFVFVAGVFAVGAFWTLLLPWRGAPFVSAAGGAAAGALIPYIHFESYLRRIPLEVTLCVAALIAAVAVLTSLLVGRRGEWRLPEVGPSIGRIALFGGISIAAFTFQWPEKMTAPPLAHTENRPPVVLIVLDTVRADHLELYGYERKTMPALQRFAKNTLSWSIGCQGRSKIRPRWRRKTRPAAAARRSC